MSLFPIFKVNKLSDKDTTDTIYVFYGSQFSEEIDDPTDLFDEDPQNVAFSQVFDKEELDYISKNKVEVIFVNQTIHIDDSIGVIKLKIFAAIDKTASMSELYLFCLKSEKLNPITVYQNLTQNDKLPLTKIRINQILLNLYNEDGTPIELGLEEKPQYNFDDILKLNFLDSDYLVGKPLGQKLVFANEYPFIANPFLVEEYDTLLERSRREVSTLSSNLLLETGIIFKNTIYLCLATDVFEVADINDVSSEYTSKIYFPFLYQDKIDTLEKLNTRRPALIESTVAKLSPETERNFENINMFYNVFEQKKPTTKFSENPLKTGITFLKIIIYPEFKIKIPIDVIFKLIHATNEFPLIKYNPESRQENIYRLFAPEITADGRKIPSLPKASIFKLMRSIGKNKSVAVYTNVTYDGINFYLCCEFEENGNIIIYPLSDFDSPILLNNGSNRFEEIDKLIYLAVNPLIEEIKPFFEQSGLHIPLFESIQSVNIEIRDLKFQTVYNIKKAIDITKFSGCISSVFTVESSNFKQGIQMRYKRVSNFNKRDSQEAFIIEKIDQGLKIDEIISELLQQYEDLDEDSATDLIVKIRTELEVVRGANKRRSLMIKINPGFQTVISANLITSEILIKVSGINDIYYLNTIPVYLDTMIRITQDIKSTNIESSIISNLCSGAEVEDIEFGQITAQSEQVLDDNEVPVIEDETAIYSNEKDDAESPEQGENMDELLDLLGFEDDENDSLEGGDGSSSESVRSEILSSSSKESKPNTVPSIGTLSSLDSLPNPIVNQEKESQSSEVSSEKLSDSSESSKKVNPIIASVPVILGKEIEEIEEEPSPILIPIKTAAKQKTVKLSNDSDEEVSEEKISLTPEEIVIPKKIEEVEIQDEIIDIPKKGKQAKRGKQAKDKLQTKDKPNQQIETNNKIMKQAENLENTVRDITGMKLKYPNPFSARLEDRMPNLFVKSKDDKFDLYTRMCPFSLSDRRQPVILTKAEKDKIIADHPGEINEEADFIEYGADVKDSSKKFYYTCPRYWCLLTNTMVTEQDILDGKCGPKVTNIEDAIIPKKAEEVPKGKYVYKFYDETERKYPGFHKQKTPSGLCIPCCYSNWSTSEMKNRRDICQGKFDEKTAEPVSEKEKQMEEELRKEVLEVEHYVKGPEKYGPQLGENRWGFLPISVQKFLHEVNEDCQISKTNMNLKLNHLCILRHGVEVNSNQSFIACLASAIFYGQRDEKTKNPLITKYIPNAKHEIPTIKEMKEIIIRSINIDEFIIYQNGDLITSFANPDLKINIEDYKDSKLYKKINLKRKVSQEDESEEVSVEESRDKQFVERVAQSFENFKNYLKDNTINIDYTYLWDLVCMPNPFLFDAGVNLIILEIPEDDATNNIELVCPTNHYSPHSFDARKRSLILIKRENYFEPIYGYRNDGKKIFVTKTFSEYDRKFPKTLRAVFAKIIKPTLGEKCRSFVSRPTEYRFKQPVILDKLIEELYEKKYKVIIQILNFQGKVIGVLAKNREGLEGFIPCFPSSLTKLKNTTSKKTCNANTCDFDFVYMNDAIWKPYDQTLEFLKEYYDYEEPENAIMANCFNPKYFCRIVEDELITGFLTNTNQFIPIKDPIPVSSVPDTIKTITNNDMLVADINTLTNNSVDNKRVDFIKRIQLETNFYNVFRNTIRILFNDYSNSEKRKKIQEECNKKYVLYITQLDNVIKMLHALVSDTIVFASKKDGFNYREINENDIHTCLSIATDKCEVKGSICRITKDKCTLVLPKNNLVNETDNEIFYYGRMADELIRYNRIKSFIFKPQAYLSFGQVKYNLRDDEIIILQDLLNQDFFENLIPAEINRYAKYNTYDTAEPIISQPYRNEVQLDEIINPYHERDCVKSEPQVIKSGYWKKCFPAGFKEIEYNVSKYCPLYLLIDLVDEFKNEKLTVEQVKDELINQYNILTDNFTNQERINKIIYILKEEAQFDANQIQDGTMTFEQMIIQDGFTAVNFDLWLLLVKYEIPSIFISSKNIPETRYNLKEFVCYRKEDTTVYAIIATPAMYRKTVKDFPIYRLIINNDKNLKINLDELPKTECLRNIENAIDQYVSIEDYLDIVFEKDVTTRYKPKQKGIRNIEFEIEEEIPVPQEEQIEIPNLVPHDEEEQIEIVPKKKSRVKKLKAKKIETTLVLEEEDEKEKVDDQPIDLENILNPVEEFEIVPPIKKTKTRKNRERKIKVNPAGKKASRKKLPDNIEIIEEVDNI